MCQISAWITRLSAKSSSSSSAKLSSSYSSSSSSSAVWTVVTRKKNSLRFFPSPPVHSDPSSCRMYPPIQFDSRLTVTQPRAECIHRYPSPCRMYPPISCLSYSCGTRRSIKSAVPVPSQWFCRLFSSKQFVAWVICCIDKQQIRPVFPASINNPRGRSHRILRLHHRQQLQPLPATVSKITIEECYRWPIAAPSREGRWRQRRSLRRLSWRSSHLQQSPDRSWMTPGLWTRQIPDIRRNNFIIVFNRIFDKKRVMYDQQNMWWNEVRLMMWADEEDLKCTIKLT